MNWKNFIVGSALAVGVIAASAGVSAAATAPSPAPPQVPAPSTAPKCDDVRDGAWPLWVQGKPDSLDAGATGGVYMWHDRDGWHVRVTHATDDKTTFTGRLQSVGTFVGVKAISLEQNDTLQVGTGGHVVNFKFENYGHIDGFDFRTSCAPSIAVTLSRGEHRLPTDRVFIGDHKAHPAGNPFRIRRTR